MPLRPIVRLKRLGRGNTKMSVYLQEVIENGGYDIIENVEDARWLLSQRDEFESLCEKAEECVEDYEEYEDFIDTQEELGNTDLPSWEEWRREKYNNN